MTDWKDSIGKITKIIAAIGGLLAAIWLVWDNFQKIWKNIIIPFWQKLLKPLLKIVVFVLSLALPNGLIIGLLFRHVAFFYWKKNSLEFMVANPTVFLQLIILQTVLVSVYSFLWAIFLYPKLRTYLFHKPNKEQKTTISGGAE